jgi:hypothetical protein
LLLILRRIKARGEAEYSESCRDEGKKMGREQTHKQGRGYFIKFIAANAAICLAVSACFAQKPTVAQTPPLQQPTVQAPAAPLIQELDKYPGLLTELSQLLEKLQHNLQFPAARSESHLLALMPASTMSYAAFSNFGDVIHQTLTIFRRELQENAVLRNWWEHGPSAESERKLEDSLVKLEQLYQYLGEEVVVAGAMEGDHPKFLMVAEIRKPGVKQVLQEWVNQAADKSKPALRVLDVKELATAEDKIPAEEGLVLVRPDFVVVGSDLATLRSFNARLDQSNREFVSTPFGQRIAQEYANGVTVLAAADLHKLLSQVPRGTQQNQESFQRSGFADMQYLVWEHATVAGQNVSQGELSFSAPRHGTASWLANPAPLGSLDFVSPQAILAGTVVFKNLAQIFENAKEIAGPANANSFAAIAQGEQALKLSLKDDLLRHLVGEITVELDSVTAQKPAWKAILKVDDANHIQQTLSTLLAVVHSEVTHVDDGGVTYYNVRVPSGKTPTEIGYAFVDGYLIVGSSHEAVAEAVQQHASGSSLAKSKKFLAALPTGHALEASALLYEDPGAMAALKWGPLATQPAEPLAQLWTGTSPMVVCVYGEESAIREVSTNSALDLGTVLVGAAIAIPNLLRSRIAANEASAVGSVRMLNVAQVVYAAKYPKLGYATELSKLASVPPGSSAASENHAGIINEPFANASCSADAGCIKSGFRFRLSAVCKEHLCGQYVVTATPVDSNTGGRSFCSTSDGVVRFKTGVPSGAPISASECHSWQLLK